MKRYAVLDLVTGAHTFVRELDARAAAVRYADVIAPILGHAGEGPAGRKLAVCAWEHFESFDLDHRDGQWLTTPLTVSPDETQVAEVPPAPPAPDVVRIDSRAAPTLDQDLPTDRCPRCGHRVTVVTDPGSGYAAWCPCSHVSKHDPEFRDVGHGTTPAEALERWREQDPVLRAF